MRALILRSLSCPLPRRHLAPFSITIDAMGTQSAIAETMVRRDGDYLLALRANWPVLHAEIARFFANPPSNKIERDEAIAENDHGRLEQRRHPICHEIDWLWSDRRYTGEPRFPHLAMVAMVDSRAERAGKWKPKSATTSRQQSWTPRRSPLPSPPTAASKIACTGCFDVVFHDDLAPLRTGFGPQNIAVVKHIAMNLVRACGNRISSGNGAE